MKVLNTWRICNEIYYRIIYDKTKPKSPIKLVNESKYLDNIKY